MACALMLAPSEPLALAGDGSSGIGGLPCTRKIVTSLERGGGKWGGVTLVSMIYMYFIRGHAHDCHTHLRVEPNYHILNYPTFCPYLFLTHSPSLSIFYQYVFLHPTPLL